jgi:hypothetical protein
MSDEAKVTVKLDDIPAVKPVVPAPTSGFVSAPISSWVKGGTHSSGYTKELEKSKADIKERREAAAADVEETRTPEPGKVGGSFAHSFSGFDPAKRPCCHVKLVNSKKETELEMLVDVILDHEGRRILNFVCPDCVSRGVPMATAQQSVRDENRKWYLDEREAGQPFYVVNAWGEQEWHVSAGLIVDTDRFRCSNPFCTFACRIHNNMMFRD